MDQRRAVIWPIHALSLFIHLEMGEGGTVEAILGIGRRNEHK